MTKETTQKIKGVAILIMIAHHFIVYDAGISFSHIWSDIGHTFKICVGIYAVLSGYGYYFAKEKSLRYGLKKTWGLLQEYWVHFFIFCMLVMPIVSKVLRFHPFVNIGIAVGAPFLIEIAIHVLIPNYQDVTMMQVLFNCSVYFGVFLVGYLMAEYDVVSKCKLHWTLGLLSMMFAIGLRIALRHVNTFGFNMDVLYAPIFVVGAANLFDGLKGKRTNAFSVLGKYSTGMWFIHAAFFATCVKDYFQPVMLIVKQPVLMYVWLVVLGLVGAVFFQYLLNGLHFCVKRVRGR